MSDAERPAGPPDPYGPQGQSGPPAGPPSGPHGFQAPQSGQPQPGQPQPGPYGPYGAQPGPYNQPGPAYGQQPYGQPGQPGQQYSPAGPAYGPSGSNPYGGPPGPPMGPGQPPPGGRKSKLPLILIAAGVALLLIVGISVAVFAGRDRTATVDPVDPVDPGASTGPTAGSSAPAAEKPSDAVRGYLEALAANDAERALGYLEDPPADQTFLTSAALEASSKQAALTGIDVPEVTDKYTFRVPARYKIGNQAVAEDYSVSESGGVYKLSRAVTEFDLSYQRDETLPLLINGVALKTDKVNLFPGTYSFTTDSRWVTYGDKAQITLTGPSDYDSPRLTPTLNAAGKTEFVKATRAAMDTCLAQRKLAPAGCPNRVAPRPDQKITESTVRWSLTNDPYKNARVSLDSTDPTVAEATFYPEYRFQAKGSQDGRSFTFDGQPTGLYLFRSEGDLSGDTVKVKLVTRG